MDGRRLLTILELEQADPNSRAHVFEPPSKDQSSAISAMQVAISQPHIMVDLIPEFPHPSSLAAQPSPERPKPNEPPKPRKNPLYG